MTRHALVRDGKIEEFRDYAPSVDQSKLAAGKPRMLPVVVENDVFDPVTQVREGPELVVEAARVVERFTVRAKTADEIEAMRLSKISKIKAIAERKILAIMPDHKQRNALALGIEMVATHGSDPAGWPADMRAVHSALMGQWASIKAIRAASNTKEAEVAALKTASAVHGYDVTMGWP